jgi:regulator of protease activity HflC (stomatin/prohibitin superfamily)
MFLIILGSLITIISFFIARGDSPLTRYATLIRVAGIVIVLLGTALSMFKVVEAGAVGVKTLYGKVDDNVLYSGLNIVNPLVEVTNF